MRAGSGELSGLRARAYQAGGGACGVGADVGLPDEAGLPLHPAGSVVDQAQAHLVQLLRFQRLCRKHQVNQRVSAHLHLM